MCNDPVIPLASATGGCGLRRFAAGCEAEALSNHRAWPIHGDRTLVEPPFGAADWRVTVPPLWAQIWVICARPQSRLPDAQSCRSMARAGSEAAWKA